MNQAIERVNRFNKVYMIYKGKIIPEKVKDLKRWCDKYIVKEMKKRAPYQTICIRLGWGKGYIGLMKDFKVSENLKGTNLVQMYINLLGEGYDTGIIKKDEWWNGVVMEALCKWFDVEENGYELDWNPGFLGRRRRRYMRNNEVEKKVKFKGKVKDNNEYFLKKKNEMKNKLERVVLDAVIARNNVKKGYWKY